MDLIIFLYFPHWLNSSSNLLQNRKNIATSWQQTFDPEYLNLLSCENCHCLIIVFFLYFLTVICASTKLGDPCPQLVTVISSISTFDFGYNLSVTFSLNLSPCSNHNYLVVVFLFLLVATACNFTASIFDQVFLNL